MSTARDTLSSALPSWVPAWHLDRSKPKTETIDICGFLPTERQETRLDYRAMYRYSMSPWDYHGKVFGMGPEDNTRVDENNRLTIECSLLRPCSHPFDFTNISCQLCLKRVPTVWPYLVWHCERGWPSGMHKFVHDEHVVLLCTGSEMVFVLNRQMDTNVTDKFRLNCCFKMEWREYSTSKELLSAGEEHRWALQIVKQLQERKRILII